MRINLSLSRTMHKHTVLLKLSVEERRVKLSVGYEFLRMKSKDFFDHGIIF
jgi:hypothetical protein